MNHPEDKRWNLDYNETINYALSTIFNFPYPIWDVEYKRYLEKKIVQEYYMDEIAHETWSFFKMRLDSKMNEIMPKYNLMYRYGRELGDIYSVLSEEINHYSGEQDRTVDTVRDYGHTGTRSDTGTQTLESSGRREDSQTSTGSTDHTGTQATVSDKVAITTSTDAGKEDAAENMDGRETSNTTGHSTEDKWVSDSPVPEGGDYKNPEWVSSAERTEGVEDTSSENIVVKDSDITKSLTTKRTSDSNVNETDNSTRTDNLHESSAGHQESTGTNTDNSTRTDDFTHTTATVDKTVGKDGEVRNDDNTRVINRKQNVTSKLEEYHKLVEYYQDVDKMIISDLECLFMGMW